MNLISDSQIIINIRNKDEETLRYLNSKFLPVVQYMVRNYKYSNGRNYYFAEKEDVDDIFQDALYIFIERIWDENFKLTSKLSTFFYAICKNLLKVKLHKKLLEEDYREYNFKQVGNNNDTDKSYDLELKRRVFDYYYDKLSDRCKDILRLYWKEYSVGMIARELDLSENYIMKRKYECKNRLIHLIKTNPDKF